MSGQSASDQAALALVFIVAAAFLLPLVGRRARVPAVVLEILFGVLVGPVFGWVEGAEFLDRLAELGFFLLMFLAGFEIDVRTFSRRGRDQVVTGLVVFALTMGGAVLAAEVLGHGVFVAFVLATTSVGLVVPTLRSTRRMQTRLGQSILVSALLADFLTLLGVTAYALWVDRGAGFHLLAIPGFFGVAALVLLLLKWVVWWRPEWFDRLFEIDDPEEIGTRASLALMLVFVAVSIAFGIEKILGAFLAGTVFAMVFRNRTALARQLNGFSYGFLIPIFFINVGLHFDMHALREPGAVTGMLVLVGAAVAVKLLPALVLLFRRLSLRESLAAGALLSARLSLIIAVAELGVRLEVIDRTLEASIIVLAAVTATLAPIVFRLLAPPLPARDEAA
ncbi:MAG: cation:proton antiporter [Actinobacteria bacterium]|nr:cation:proton antiporter [Actinomycetota bacterium]